MHQRPNPVESSKRPRGSHLSKKMRSGSLSSAAYCRRVGLCRSVQARHDAQYVQEEQRADSKPITCDSLTQDDLYVHRYLADRAEGLLSAPANGSRCEDDSSV